MGITGALGFPGSPGIKVSTVHSLIYFDGAQSSSSHQPCTKYWLLKRITQSFPLRITFHSKQAHSDYSIPIKMFIWGCFDEGVLFIMSYASVQQRLIRVHVNTLWLWHCCLQGQPGPPGARGTGGQQGPRGEAGRVGLAGAMGIQVFG